MAVIVYLPLAGGALADVRDGSAIVGTGRPNYRGNLAVAIAEPQVRELAQNFADRVEEAAIELRDTSKLREVPESDAVPVATFQGDRVTIEYAREGGLLMSWLGVSTLDNAELQTTRSIVHGLQREFERARSDTPQPRRRR
jgi:hypothetical protein